MKSKRKLLNWKLPHEIENRLGENTYGGQRVIAEAGHQLIILHRPPHPDQTSRETVLFLRKPDGSMLANGHDRGELKLRKLLTEYRDLWQECDKAYDSAQDSTQLLQLIERLAPVNRTAANLARTLQAAREAARDDRFLIGMRDESEEIARAFDLLTADAKLKLDYRIAANSEAQAEQTRRIFSAQHRLNVLAAITLPTMAVATVFGMNLHHGLEDRPVFIFGGVLVTALLTGLIVKHWVAK